MVGDTVIPNNGSFKEPDACPVSWKGTFLLTPLGLTPLPPRASGLRCWLPAHLARTDIQCLCYRFGQCEEQVFSCNRDGEFIWHFLIKGVEDLVWGTLMGNSC
jgi:hypothetical protein